MKRLDLRFAAAPLRQRGWSILEAAVVTALLGVMTAVVWRAVESTGKKQAAAEEWQAVQGAADAVYGAALVNFRFPAPEDAAPSPGRPGYVEGWLDPEKLGLKGYRKIRYLVDAALLDVPGIYQPDPLRLAGGAIKTRASKDVNLLDLCHLLVDREHSGLALPGGMRLAFAVQEAVNAENPGASYTSLWLGDGASAAVPAGVEFGTQTAGYGEAAARMGCMKLMAEVAVSAKATMVRADTVKLMDQEVMFDRMALTAAEETVVNLSWRMANWSLGISMIAWQTPLLFVQMKTTPLAYGVTAAGFASSALAIAGLGIFLNQTDEALKSAKKSLPEARLTVATSQAYRDSLRKALQEQINETNALQKAE